MSADAEFFRKYITVNGKKPEKRDIDDAVKFYSTHRPVVLKGRNRSIIKWIKNK